MFSRSNTSFVRSALYSAWRLLEAGQAECGGAGALLCSLTALAEVLQKVLRELCSPYWGPYMVNIRKYDQTWFHVSLVKAMVTISLLNYLESICVFSFLVMTIFQAFASWL